mgnify:CR=1 FL=1
MDSIIESATPWRTTTELAVATNAAPEKEAPNAGDVDDDDGFKIFSDDGFTFLDFLDIINPLQHIPVIGTLYRELTGDTFDPGSRVLGDTLFFGPVGTVVSLANVLVKLVFLDPATTVPLSIAYIDPASRVIEIHDMHPGNTKPVESRSARIQYALEVNQGWFAKNGIKPGTVLATDLGSLAVSVRAK